MMTILEAGMKGNGMNVMRYLNIQYKSPVQRVSHEKDNET